jgi:hypothetical protein
MSTQHPLLLFLPEIPDLDAPIVPPGYELFVRRGEGDGTDGFSVGEEGFEVVYGWGVVLKDTALVP